MVIEGRSGISPGICFPRAFATNGIGEVYSILDDRQPFTSVFGTVYDEIQGHMVKLFQSPGVILPGTSDMHYLKYGGNDALFLFEDRIPHRILDLKEQKIVFYGEGCFGTFTSQLQIINPEGK